MFSTRFKRRSALKQLDIVGQPVPYAEIADTRSGVGEPLLLIGLHGHGSNERQMGSLVAVELERPFLYVAPRGFLPLDEGFTWLPIGFSGGQVSIDEQQLRKAVERLAAFIQEMQRQSGIPPKRTFLIGYSLGAGLSLAVSLAYPELVGGSAVMAGTLLPGVAGWSRRQQLAGKPFFVGYGSLDPLISPEDAQRILLLLEQQSAQVTFREYRIPHVVSQAEREDLGRWLAEVARKPRPDFDSH